MACRILIENPPPFKQAAHSQKQKPTAVPVEEGAEIAACYINAGVRFAGFQHSDLDWYEARQMRGEPPPERYDTLAYADYVKANLDAFSGVLIPHRVIVYQPPEVHATAFRNLASRGIKDIVFVGKPFSRPPPGVVYRNTVERMLSYVVNQLPSLELNLGVVVIHERQGETERLARKFEAAGRQKLRLIGQFLDSAGPALSFMDALASEFGQRGFSLDRLEWNVGLAMFTLKNRTFHAKLLRKDQLACEKRFHGLPSVEARVDESVRMNLEFAEQIKDRGHQLGVSIGFSIQPIIERNRDGTIHAGLYGAVELVKQLNRLYQ